MSPALVKRVVQAIARPLSVLVPMIQEEVADGNTAGLEHYCEAGELLLEARDQVAEFKWTKWLRENFALSAKTAYTYMALAERIREDPGILKTSSQSMFEIVNPKEHQRRKARRAAFKLHKAVDQFDVTRLARIEETRLLRLLAVELIDIGYKALATRLHPDHGGTNAAFRRLNRVRSELKAVAKTRRYE